MLEAKNIMCNIIILMYHDLIILKLWIQLYVACLFDLVKRKQMLPSMSLLIGLQLTYKSCQ